MLRPFNVLEIRLVMACVKHPTATKSRCLSSTHYELEDRGSENAGVRNGLNRAHCSIFKTAE